MKIIKAIMSGNKRCTIVHFSCTARRYHLKSPWVKFVGYSFQIVSVESAIGHISTINPLTICILALLCYQPPEKFVALRHCMAFKGKRVV